MFSFLADEDFNGRILRGLLRRASGLDVTRVQDVGLQGVADEVVLQWAEDHKRLLLTHDARTMPREANTRLRTGRHHSGVCVVDNVASIGGCISDILLVVECSNPDEWHDRIYYLPLK